MYTQQPAFSNFYSQVDQNAVPINVQVSLVDEHIWKEFSAHTTEMIVSKPGRKLFPKLALDIKGLVANERYAVSVDFERVDLYRYRFEGGKWTQTTEEEEAEGRSGKSVTMNGEWRRGKDLMDQGLDLIDFSLTNNPDERRLGMVFIQSQHRYVPVVSIFHVTGSHNSFNKHPVAVARLDAAEFIAVTCYQNDAIKKLKVVHNPFARGSRSVHNTDENRSGAVVQQGRKRPATREERAKRGRRSPSPSIPSTPPSLPLSSSSSFPTPSPTISSSSTSPEASPMMNPFLFFQQQMPLSSMLFHQNPFNFSLPAQYAPNQSLKPDGSSALPSPFPAFPLNPFAAMQQGVPREYDLTEL